MTREELWLAAIAGLDGVNPPDYPVWHYEEMLAAIYDAVVGADSPRQFPERSWHLDEFLYAVYCVAAGLDDPGCPEPTDRIELFWKGVYDGVKGEAGASVPTPVWRIEEFLSAVFTASAGWGERTLTGSIVSFIGRASTEILALTAAITPVQAGSGDPSLTNVRPITGYTGANIYVSPTQNQADATTYTVSWSGSAGTVYGGTLDVLTGKLTVTHVGIDMGSVDYTMNTTHKFAAFFPTGTNAMVEFNSADEVAPIMCSAYKVGTYTNTWTNVNDGICAYVAGGGQEKFGVIDHNYSDKDSFKTAVTGQKIVYPLKTQKTYNLTAQQVAALVGQNYVWADTGDVTVTVKGAGVA